MHATRVFGCVTSLSPSADASEIAVGTNEGNLYRMRAENCEVRFARPSHV